MELSGKIYVATRTTTTTTTIQLSLLLDCSVPIVSSNVDVQKWRWLQQRESRLSGVTRTSYPELRHHVLAGADIESLAGVQTKSRCPEPTTLKRRDLKKMQVRGVSGRKWCNVPAVCARYARRTSWTRPPSMQPASRREPLAARLTLAAAYRLTPPHSCGPCAKILLLVSSGKKERDKSSNKKSTHAFIKARGMLIFIIFLLFYF